MQQVIKIIVMVIFILVCVALTFLVLMQEGKQQGLGAIGGIADTYWGKNKGRSMEGVLVKVTTILAIAFMIIALLLNIPIIFG
ncbi:MAG: preprotein translocase subunit SecG [Lachnospiraceae bacterium]|nr:preprotein translocase subunit SecG [Lachnospiraceae bacterium]MBR5067309.1 preprotein translocase subunit SecG [Lachnospiraceae bacterium]MBR5918232.1 preprotein translocase subunit SecG [Lachnospiraceae bacterium]